MWDEEGEVVLCSTSSSPSLPPPRLYKRHLVCSTVIAMTTGVTRHRCATGRHTLSNTLDPPSASLLSQLATLCDGLEWNAMNPPARISPSYHHTAPRLPPHRPAPCLQLETAPTPTKSEQTWRRPPHLSLPLASAQSSSPPLDSRCNRGTIADSGHQVRSPPSPTSNLLLTSRCRGRLLWCRVCSCRITDSSSCTS